jgi:VWFA-related protein
MPADVDMASISVSVVDAMDHPITSLMNDNFEVFEDNKPQRITTFSSKDTPMSVGLILDTSSSMAPMMEQSRLAVKQFIRAANPGDEFFLISFGDCPIEESGFTNDTALLMNKLESIKASGSTSLLDAIDLGIYEMRKAKFARKALVVISGGRDYHSRHGEGDILSAFKKTDVQFYAVDIYESEPELVVYTPPEEVTRPRVLNALAEMTGGREFGVEILSLKDLPAAVAYIALEMRSVYVLGYTPMNQQRDRRWRNIQVKLRVPKKMRSELRVFHRSGYYVSER